MRSPVLARLGEGKRRSGPERPGSPQKIWEPEKPKGLFCFLSIVCDLFPIWIDVLQ